MDRRLIWRNPRYNDTRLGEAAFNAYGIAKVKRVRVREGHKCHAKYLDGPGVRFANIKHQPFVPGERIRHYRIISAIGSGGMGDVYLAEDTRLGRKVAIKLLRPSFIDESNRLGRFEREARAASALNHPNLCTIHEVGELEDGRLYIVMEYVDGMTLRQRMGEGYLSLSEVLDIAVQASSALAAAHNAGIVHRDIKPENIAIRPDRIVKVLDFDQAKLTEQRRDADSSIPTQVRAQTETGMVMGTARYMSRAAPQTSSAQPNYTHHLTAEVKPNKRYVAFALIAVATLR